MDGKMDDRSIFERFFHGLGTLKSNPLRLHRTSPTRKGDPRIPLKQVFVDVFCRDFS